MSGERSGCGSHARILSRILSALDELMATLRKASPALPHVRQMRELLILWEAFPTHDDREGALGALRDLTIRYRQ